MTLEQLHRIRDKQENEKVAAVIASSDDDEIVAPLTADDASKQKKTKQQSVGGRHTDDRRARPTDDYYRRRRERDGDARRNTNDDNNGDARRRPRRHRSRSPLSSSPSRNVNRHKRKFQVGFEYFLFVDYRICHVRKAHLNDEIMVLTISNLLLILSPKKTTTSLRSSRALKRYESIESRRIGQLWTSRLMSTNSTTRFT